MQMMWKVNGVSVLYAFSLFMQMELLMNVYRLERVTGIAHMDRYVPVAVLLLLVLFSILAYVLTKLHLNPGKRKYLTTILWIPYFLLFIKGFAYIYPITDPQEVPLPGIGLVVIAACGLYPLYIAGVTFWAGVGFRDPKTL
ncbi:hypothetical protein SAMN02744102_04195 [Paenibacillus barengoltzii]|uniref:hypothetical protein n=1 Tax=Paenibacillus TaxID=44249 RepID=UPI0004ACEB64|nr:MULTISPECIES: hypothetical protein [Paenibacillus]SMF61001.1 hypothetical protein SAMN02744102_04195 [Paenibacillus barengoltzii]